MLKKLSIAVVALLFGGITLAQEPKSTIPIIPKPLKVQTGQGNFALSKQTVILVPNADLKQNATLFNQWIEKRYGFKLPITTVDRQENIIRLAADTAAGQEAYHLQVANRTIQISGGNAGVFYGFQSLLQLIEKQNGTLFIPEITIQDKPEFGYRGIMIDVARHFFEIDELKKIIDVMAYFKFNRFHWHLTEDQGWRLEIKKYPKLTEIAAYRDSTILGQYYDFKPFVYDGKKHGGFYTQEEARDLVKYAADRKITIVPEIELPGHSTATLAAYPELGVKDTTYQVAGFWGVHPNIYAPKDVTVKFLEDVLTEVMDIFPSEFIHIGGDEVPKDHWEKSTEVQGFMKKNKLKDEHELQSYFIRRIEQFLNKNGRRLIGWDEILEGGLAPNATVMSWRGEKGGIAAARMGHDVIMTPNSHLYIDHYQAEDITTEPVAIGGFLPLEKVYSYYPRPDSLTADQQKHVLGVQANLWTEYIPTSNKLEYMLFPRALALSEVAWSAREQQNYQEFSEQRLPWRLQDLEAFNIQYRIPEAKTAFGKHEETGRNTLTITPFVANSTIYYTLDGHKADQNGTLYTGPIELPWFTAQEKPKDFKLNYIIQTPGGRVSNQFSVPLSTEK